MEEHDRAQGRSVITRLADAIDAAIPELSAPVSDSGVCLTTGGGFMLRACDPIREALAVEAEVHACALTLRSVVELSIVGRYFIVGPDAMDELGRRLNEGHVLEAKLADQLGLENASLPAFVRDLVIDQRPRNLATLSTELDKVDGRLAGDSRSTLHVYRLVYKYVSNSVTHANATSLKRYTGRRGNELFLRQADRPAVETPPLARSAALLGALAVDLFRAFEISANQLPSEIIAYCDG